MKMRFLLAVLLLATAGLNAGIVTDGLAVHLDAGSISGLLNGDDLSLWPDISGNDNDAGDAGYSFPTYQTNIISSLPVVRFEDTAGDALAIGATADLNGQQKTIFVVAAHDTVGGGDFILRSNYTSAGYLWGIHCDSSNYFRASTTKPSWTTRTAPDSLGADFHILAIFICKKGVNGLDLPCCLR